MLNGFQQHQLSDEHTLHNSVLPDALRFSGPAFEKLWRLHPDEYHEIKIHGRAVKTPRWQQAYGADYYYTGRGNKALPVPPLLQPLLDWSRGVVAKELNGLLLNWYDGSKGHYIGKHRDSITNMVTGSPIVTISFGEERTFRLRPWRQTGFQDFPARDSTVFVMPYDTNLAWTHEVPMRAKRQGRRISVTIRAFVS
jgi:alkylated DNA repair dioxygenase AlkB